MAETANRGRMPRKEQVREERRRKRGGLDMLAGQKLTVSEEFLDRENYQYRWINDDGARLRSKTVDDDWDLVHDPDKQAKEDVDGLGSVVTKVVGRTKDGKPLNAYLARKRKDWFEADKREKERPLDAVDEALKRGQVAATNPEAKAMQGHSYVPEGGISIEDGRRN